MATSILLASGCFSKPGFNGGGTDDARGDGGPDAASCTGVFSTPVAIPQTNGLVTGEPTIAGNLLELYWAHDSTSWLIERASRSSTTGTWGTGASINFGQGTVIDADPSITDDGTLMILRISSGGVPILVQSEKTGGTWGTVAAVQGLTSIHPSSLDLSGDGLTLYYNDAANNLRVATRGDRLSAFVDSGGTFGNGFSFPTVSADGLLMFFSNGIGGTSRATRPTTADSFSIVGEELADYKDPDLTQDGTTLVVAKDQKIHIATRSCP